MIWIFFTFTSVIFNNLDSVKPSCSLSCHPVLNSFKIKIPSRESYFLGFEIYCEESCSQAVVRASKGHNYENHQKNSHNYKITKKLFKRKKKEKSPDSLVS